MTALTIAQQQRVEALKAARDVLVHTEAKGPFTSPSKSPGAVPDLLELATYIIGEPEPPAPGPVSLTIHAGDGFDLPLCGATWGPEGGMTSVFESIVDCPECRTRLEERRAEQPTEEPPAEQQPEPTHWLPEHRHFTLCGLRSATVAKTVSAAAELVTCEACILELHRNGDGGLPEQRTGE